MVNTTLAFDASLLVQVRAIGASREDALPALSSFFNRRPEALHICLNEGPCAVEDVVFHVRRLELWSGSGFPGHRLSVAGRKWLKQLLTPGGDTAEDEAHREEEDPGGRMEDLTGEDLAGKEQAKRPGVMRKEKGKGGILKTAGPKRKAKEKATAEPLQPRRERLEKVRQKQQDLGRGQGVRGGWRCSPCSGRIDDWDEDWRRHEASWRPPCRPERYIQGAKRRYLSGHFGHPSRPTG